MLNNRLNAAKEVNDRLHALEAAIDEAIARAAEFAASMPQARQRAKISAIVGQDAITKAGETLNTLIIARAQIVDAHEKLADVRDKLGLKTFMGGPLWKFKESASDESTPLTLVSDQAA
jgi:hypothetical protein